MNQQSDPIAEAAAAWHVASTDDSMDWDGFSAWLAEDPRHAAAYDEIALTDDLLSQHRGSLQAVEPAAAAAPGISSKAWRWTGAAIAASLIAVVVAPQFRSAPAMHYATHATSRTITLEDGSQVALAPHSSLTVASGDERLALSGGALFDIRHDPARKLIVTAGDVSITDIGTRFDVQASREQVRVAVAQGDVAVSSSRLDAPVRVGKGRALLYDGKAGTAVVAPVAVPDVGAWRNGRLTYAAAPVALVADDLARYAAVRVTADPSVADRKFSGTLTLGDGEAAVRDLSQLMALDLVRDHGGGYRLQRGR